MGEAGKDALRYILRDDGDGWPLHLLWRGYLDDQTETRTDSTGMHNDRFCFRQSNQCFKHDERVIIDDDDHEADEPRSAAYG